MEFNGHLLTSVIVVCICLMAIIHLGVSIGIIAEYRKYGDVFRPQIGLSSFNLVISFFGLVAGIAGVVAAQFSQKLVGKIAFVSAAVTGVFALASLVAAIIINAKSPDYVNSRFQDAIMKYATDDDARDKVDMIQIRWTCCGGAMWVDWSNAKLSDSMIPMNGTTTSTTAMTTTTTATIVTTTTATTTTTTTSSSGKKKRNVNYHSNTLNDQDFSSSLISSRQKRQAMNMYGDIYGLPTSFCVALPLSCFDPRQISSNMTIDMPYFLSNASSFSSSFYTQGCSKALDFNAGNQALGFSVINSFMVVLAFAAMPLLFEDAFKSEG